MAQLPVDVRFNLRMFAFFLANGTLDPTVLPLRNAEGHLDYQEALMSEPSWHEAVFNVFANVIDVDEAGKVTNADHAGHRAAQLIRTMLDPEYIVSPPFEEWETELACWD